MQPIWKPLAFMALASTAFLAALVIYVSVRENPMNARMRRNVSEQIRYHLEQKEPAKAAEALDSDGANLFDPAEQNALRLEIARASTPETGVRILDGLQLAAMDPAQAAEAAQTRLDLQRRLFESSVLQKGALPAPFEPEVFLDRGVPTLNAAEMKSITAKLLVLITDRRDLAKRQKTAAVAGLDALESLAVAARYALGEIPFEAVKIADPETRFLFGDLLFRERQFDRALEQWRSIAADPRVGRRIAELSALRRLAPKYLHLWNFDVDGFPPPDPKIEAEVAAAVKSDFDGARPGGMPRRLAVPVDVASEGPIDEPAIFFPEAREMPLSVPPTDPQQLYLLVEHRTFDFSVPFDRPFLTKADPELRLRSSYTGPIRFRLFRVADLETLAALDGATIAARRAELKPVRDWEHQYAALGPNGGNDADWLVQVASPGPGLFVLLADARYCPVYAFARFIVTDTGLIQQAASDRVLIHSVDRISGAPAPDLPLDGQVSGHYMLRPKDLLPQDDSDAGEYRRGFTASWAGKPSEPDASPSYLTGYGRGGALKSSHPDLDIPFQGVTDKEGLFDWMVQPAWREGYQYRIRTRSMHGATCTRVESTYVPDTKGAALLSVVYTDRPLYRAGDVVSFKALLRQRDNEGLQPFEDKEAFFEVRAGERTIYARSLPINGFGTAIGTIDLNEECARGDYHVRVNNGPVQHLFRVEDYRKPEFEIVLQHPKKVRAGDGVDVSVLVRRYSGEPLARTEVQLSFQAAPIPGAARLVDENGWPAPASRNEWRNVESRSITTDGDGRLQVRFQTELRLASRYVITASAHEESGRPMQSSSGFEAALQIREILSETDRPVYYPGETARIRFLAPGAATIRLEERAANLEKPFSISVALKEGSGFADYPVPATPRDLQLGVREGEGWTWTAVPLVVRPNNFEGGLVGVRLDRPLYKVGEKAVLEIEGSDPSGSVLLVSATGRIHRRQVVPLRNRRARVELEVRDEDIPNIHLVALTVKNDQMAKATAVLNVPPVDRFLTVEVSTDLAEYRPGQECSAVVRVTDSQGRPVPDCELSLGVVDESIYSLHEDATPDLREYFHRYSRPLGVGEAFFYKEPLPPFTVWKSPVFIHGRMGLYESLGVGMGGGSSGRYGGRFGGRANLVARGGGTTGMTPPPRSDFKDTAYWSARLQTGADGTATARFAFPDNLTRFRFTARGITRTHQVGEVRQQTVVRKPFFVRLAGPRVLQEGNVIGISGIVHNQTDKPQTVRVAFRSPFALLGSTAPAAIVLLPGDSARLEYLVSVDKFVPSAELTFSADSDLGETDGVAIRIPGRRNGSPFLEGRSGSVAGGSPREEVFRLPASAIPETVMLNVEVDAGIHNAILSAIDPLIEYPYGCVEQTMSRFLPAVAAQRALGGVPARLQEKLPAVVAAGLQRLYQLQNPDGSWGWWNHDSSNAPLTAYVLYGLSICKKAGIPVDRSVADKAAKLLMGRLAQSVFNQNQYQDRLPLQLRIDPRIYELLAAAEHHAAWGLSSITLRQLIATMADRSAAMNAADRIVLALAAARIGMTEAADALALKSEGEAPSNVATASFLLQLQAVRGGDLAPAVRYILGHRSGRGWASTIESAHAILGLAAALERPTPALDLPPGRMEIRVNGAVVQELTLRGAADAAFDGRYRIPAPPGGWGEKAVVRFTFEGQGSAFYTASIEGMKSGGTTLPVSNGLSIRREYFERDDDGSGWRPVDGDITRGRVLLVVLRVESPNRRDYLMVTDPRPDGFEPLDLPASAVRGQKTVVQGLTDQVDLDREWPARLDDFRKNARDDKAKESAWAKAVLKDIILGKRFKPILRTEELSLPDRVLPAHVEHRDDRTIFFLNTAVGEEGLWYFVRAEHPGRLLALPPRVEAMYEPEFHGAGVETALTVADGVLVRTVTRTLENAPGVDGLLELLPLLDEVDADQILAKIPSNPRIGDLLMPVCNEKAVLAWLTADPAIRAAGRGLKERIEAARRDLTTRMLGVEATDPTLGLLPPLLDALGDDRLTLQVLRDADPNESGNADNILLWTSEDREFRLALVAAVQKLRGNSRIQSPNFPRLGLSRVMEALGSRAPTGSTLLNWKLSQRLRFPVWTIDDLAARCARDLSLTVRARDVGRTGIKSAEGTLEEILNKVLPDLQLYYRIQNDEIVIGTLEDLLR